MSKKVLNGLLAATGLIAAAGVFLGLVDVSTGVGFILIDVTMMRFVENKNEAA